MLVQLGEGALIVLLQFVILIANFFLRLLLLHLDARGLENLHHYGLGLLLQKNIVQTHQPC